MFFSLIFASLAASPAIDADANGNIITVRPLEGHTVGVFDQDGTPFVLPSAMHQPMWLVHPDAWRKAVALVEQARVTEQLVPELKNENFRLSKELKEEKRIRSELRVDLASSQAAHAVETKMLRRSRTHWAIGTGSAAAVVGVIVGVFVIRR